MSIDLDKAAIVLWGAYEGLSVEAATKNWNDNCGLGDHPEDEKSQWRKTALAAIRASGVVEVLEEIAARGMSREQFMFQGPAFACRQVEASIADARAALALLKDAP
jgi:hypothetical protein